MPRGEIESKLFAVQRVSKARESAAAEVNYVLFDLETVGPCATIWCRCELLIRIWLAYPNSRRLEALAS